MLEILEQISELHLKNTQMHFDFTGLYTSTM